ncbi:MULTISPECIES: hypothetical protein [unclassified Methylophaga]|jgi:hypothetical protein|uniref:hypothetical protein n=1 Tax=unclassified Methylophaga TaxID=2629249 RepID=UPI00259CF12F|nr:MULTISPECIES: hypothetical protein [unclassified Methylophaga]|tara:strand:+ start:34798 stop:35526 length:729 start_codon:yes stop_codon:yes gene_type:complete
MRSILVILSISLIASCVSRHESKDSINYFMSQGMSVSDATAAYKAMHRTELLVYPATASWREDSVFINQSDLYYAVRDMVQCPQPPPEKDSLLKSIIAPSRKAITFTPSLRKEVSIQTDGVHVVVNRANCSVDVSEVKDYIDNQIRENRVKAEKRFADEKKRKETDPEGPFTIGCEDYKRSFRGENILTVNEAIKSYEKINRKHVINLYNLGFNAAKYSVVNADCNYLYQLHFNGTIHRHYY